MRTHNHQLSVNGGNDRTQFYVGLGYNNAEGIVIGSDFERFSGRINLDHQVNNWLTIGVKQMIAFTTQNGFRDQQNQDQGIGTASPLSLVYSSDPTARKESGRYIQRRLKLGCRFQSASNVGQGTMD